MANSSGIDWHRLAKHLGATGRGVDSDNTERGGTDLARAALESILTREQIVSAVDHYVSLQPGFELARSVLSLLRPWSAMLRCREIFASADELDDRRTAVELLRVIADRRVISWIPEFLADPDPGIQNWGIGILDQLVFAGLVDSDESNLVVDLARAHDNETVRTTAIGIAARLDDEAG
jgi:hypothetical protein